MNYRAQAAERSLVVSAFDNHVFGTDLATGSRVWTYECLARVPRIEIVGGRAFVLGWQLFCLEFETGREIWKVELPASFGQGTLLVTGDAVVVGGSGEVACFEAATGAPRWHDKFAGMGTGSVALAVPGNAVQIDMLG